MDIIKKYKSSLVEKQTTIIKAIDNIFTEHAKLIKNIAEEKEPNFRFTEQNKIVLRLMLYFFTGNLKFDLYLKEITGRLGSRNKGLCIIGNVGSGKSLLLERVFKEYTKIQRKNSYQVHDYYNIIRDYELEGAVAIKKYGYLNDNLNGYQKDNTATVLIDDFLSTKSTASHYGNKTDIADMLISYRYEAYQRSRKLTHFTMNLYPNQLGEILDERSISRLQEMCNIIALEGCDWRTIEFAA